MSLDIFVVPYGKDLDGILTLGAIDARRYIFTVTMDTMKTTYESLTAWSQEYGSL